MGEALVNARLQAAHDWLWETEHRGWPVRALVHVLRYIVVLGRDLGGGQLSMRAMSLVYTTLLSLVPLLALGFSMFKGLGAHNALEPTLLRFLEPLGEQGEELAGNVIGFVENIQVGVLGSLGVGLLLYAAISLIQKVETSFNWIWRVRRERSLGARFSEYLSVLIVGPFAIFLSIGVTASAVNNRVVQTLAEIEPFGTLVYGAAKLVPYLIIIGVFTFLYSFIPNTRVRLRAALGGGVFAGVLWQSASMGFATFVSSASNYNAIYSSFAILIFLLIWLYLAWLILMLGCQLTFYLAHPEYVTPDPRETRPSPRSVEQIGLALVAEVAARATGNGQHATRNALVRVLKAPGEYVEPVIDLLIARGVLAETLGEPSVVVPARDMSSLSLSALWMLLRTDPRARGKSRSGGMRRADDALSNAEAGFDERYGALSIKDWLAQGAGQ